MHAFIWPVIRGCFHRVLYQGSAHSRAFYLKAKKNLWLQAAMLCGAGITAQIVIVVKNLTVFGGGTPVIFFNIQVGPWNRLLVVLTFCTRDFKFVGSLKI